MNAVRRKKAGRRVLGDCSPQGWSVNKGMQEVRGRATGMSRGREYQIEREKQKPRP